MEDEQLVDVALLAGKALALANAEANRIEDTIQRILCISSFQSIDVLAQNSNIIITLLDRSGRRCTRMVRLNGHALALDKIDTVNKISRLLCEQALSTSQAHEHLSRLLEEKNEHVANKVIFGLWALGPAFVLVFKGGWIEVIFVMLLATLYVGLYRIAWKWNTLLFYLLVSTLLSFTSINLQHLAMSYKWTVEFDIVIISAIMPMVPGIAITNALRDIMHQDYVSGMSKFMESITHTGSIAFGIGFGFTLGAILWN